MSLDAGILALRLGLGLRLGPGLDWGWVGATFFCTIKPGDELGLKQGSAGIKSSFFFIKYLT